MPVKIEKKEYRINLNTSLGEVFCFNKGAKKGQFLRFHVLAKQGRGRKDCPFFGPLSK